MHPKRLRCLPAATLGLVAAALAAPSVAQTTLTPGSVSTVLDPGQVQVVDYTATLVGAPFDDIDVYILVDATTSMSSAIGGVVAQASQLVDALAALSGDVRVGVGWYTELQSGTACGFTNLQSITDDTVASKQAVSLLTTSTGCSNAGFPEAQFYAMHRLAVDPAIGFRPDAKHLLVWIGDAPGNQPLCPTVTGEAGPIDEVTVTAELVGAGIEVLAFSLATSPQTPQGLDSDPLAAPQDPFILNACGPQDGTAGQATRIAAATGGVLIDSTTSILVDAVIAAITTAAQVADVALVPDLQIASFVTSVDPPIHAGVTVAQGASVTLDFKVTFTGQPCDPVLAPFVGDLRLTSDGVTGATSAVTIGQPQAIAVAYGSGWAGTFGVPTVSASAAPVLGSTIDVLVSNSSGAPTVACGLVGYAQQQVPSGFGGDVLVVIAAEFGFDVPIGGGSVQYVIPNDPAQCGLNVYFQAALIDPGALNGVALSHGLRLNLGT